MIKNSIDKILCVDDEDNILNMFRRTIGREYRLCTANSAETALNILREQTDFALIISDFTMPDVNGVEFLKLAREYSPDTVQVMLTGNIELDIAIKTINETNVFRYLPKPCPIEELRKVIAAALNQYHLIIDRQRLLEELAHKNLDLEAKNAQLAKQKILLEHELEMARIVYSKVFDYGHVDYEGLDYLIAAKETVGGDFLLTHADPGLQYVYMMLGDLTGHGLQSALAALLVTELFEVHCAANPEIEQLACDINDKMCLKLPTGLFLAALLLRLNLQTGEIQIWQGGMPDAFFLDSNGQVMKAVSSNNLPLGILADQNFVGTSTSHHVSDAVSLFVYSDGVIEQLEDEQSMFGYESLINALSTTQTGQRRVDAVLERLRSHQNHQQQGDDISMFELHFATILKTLL